MSTHNDEHDFDDDEDDIDDLVGPPANANGASSAGDTEVPPPPPKRPPGRPKGSKTKGVGSPASGVVSSASAAEPPAAQANPQALLEAIKREPTKDATVRWPMILDYLQAVQLPPAAVSIQVYRMTSGAYGAPGQMGTQMPNSIPGEMVAGDPGTPPGDALIQFIAEYLHMPANLGPTKYRLRVYYRSPPPWASGGAGLADMELNLDSSQAVAGWLQQANAFKARVQQQPQWGAGVGVPPAAHGLGALPPGPALVGPPGYWMPPPQAAAPGTNNELVQQLLAMLAPHLQPGGASQASPPIVVQPPPAPAAPAPKSPLEQMQEQMAFMKAFASMAETMGFQRPGAVAPAPAVGVGALPPAAPAALQVVQPAAPMTFADQIKSVVSAIQQAEQLKKSVGASLGLVDPADQEEEEEPAAKPEEKAPFKTYPIPMTEHLNDGHPIMAVDPPDGEEWSLAKRAYKYVEANPVVAMKWVGMGMEILDKSTLGAVVKTIAERGVVGMGQVPAPAQARQMGPGVRAPSQPPPPQQLPLPHVNPPPAASPVAEPPPSDLTSYVPPA